MALSVHAGSELGGRRGLGWIPDVRSVRDYTAATPKVKKLLGDTSVPKLKKSGVPKKVDLRQWCSPIEDQKELGSCTAQAGVGMLEYYERKAFGKHIDGSRLFLYKATRQLGGLAGDSGAALRMTMGAMALLGVPPEEFWPYTDDPVQFDIDPPPFCYSFAQNFQALTYYRLDPAGTQPKPLLDSIKAHLASQIPAIFGFAVFGSIAEAIDDGKIPFPTANDSFEGGHAVLAVGYDDNVKVPNQEGETKGALLIRNSWSAEWGEDGYGWLPYDYVLEELANDWWVMLESEWIDTGAFTAG